MDYISVIYIYEFFFKEMHILKCIEFFNDYSRVNHAVYIYCHCNNDKKIGEIKVLNALTKWKIKYVYI